MKAKEKAKASIAVTKSFLDSKKVEEEKKLKQEEDLVQAINKGFNNNKGEKSMKKISKQLKHELALIKTLAISEAKADNRAVTAEEFGELVKQYQEETEMEQKAIDLTSDHANLLREIQSSDIQFTFDAKSDAGAILALFQRWTGAVNGKVKIPVLAQSIKMKHLAETASAQPQSTTETLLTLEVTRANVNFQLSRTLDFKSIQDRIQFLESAINLAVEKGMVEGIVNGQGAASPQQDTGYASDEMGKKFPGLRALLSVNSYVKDMANAPLTGDDGRTAMQALFDAAGPEFSRSQNGYVMFVARKERLLLSALKKGSGVTGVNPAAGNSVYESDYQGVPIVEIDFLRSRVGSGTGYDATGFVSSTAADNDHGVIILCRPSAMWYALQGERLDLEYKPNTDSFEINLNCQAGWAMLIGSGNQPGVYGVNIGADV